MASILLLVAAAIASTPPAPVIRVSRTCDNVPFSYRVELASEREAFRVYRLTYPSPVRTEVPQNNTIPAEYFVPRGIEPGAARRPAVICLHILDGNVELIQIACSALAARGIPALWFKLPYYGERGLPEGPHAIAANQKLFVGALSQTGEDVRRTVDLLASRPEIDPQHIGIMGISLGGLAAATAAEHEPRLSRAALLLAGGDLLPIIDHAREARELREMLGRLPPDEKAAIERAIMEVDPLRQAARLRDRALHGKVLMINATDDEVIPRASAEKLAGALGIADRVVWLEGLGHYTALSALPRALRTTADFFAQDLPADAKPWRPAVASRTPERIVASLLAQVGDVLTAEPSQGRCHMVDVEASVTLNDGRKADGRFRLVRGPRPKFSVYGKVSSWGEVSLGCGDHPWMIAREKTVFRGVAAPGAKPVDPLAWIDQRHLMKLQMLSGGLAALALAPDVLDRWVRITSEKTGDQVAAIRIVRKGREQDFARIVLDDDRIAPRSASFEIEGARGTVTFHAWQLGAVAHESLFQEPAGLAVKEVDQADLARMFSGLLNFTMESIR